jgi:hypothetical protein
MPTFPPPPLQEVLPTYFPLLRRCQLCIDQRLVQRAPGWTDDIKSAANMLVELPNLSTLRLDLYTADEQAMLDVVDALIALKDKIQQIEVGYMQIQTAPNKTLQLSNHGYQRLRLSFQQVPGWMFPIAHLPYKD